MKTVSVLRRVLAVCLVMIALVTAVPVISYAEDYYDVMYQFDSRIQKPKKTSILANAEVYYVRSKNGNCIYAYSRPNKDSKHIGRVDEGSAIMVYAREAGFALGMVSGTTYGGWMREELLRKQSPDGVPGPSDTAGLPEGYYRPKRDEYLRAYETMYVQSKYGNCIYMYRDPTETPLVTVYKVKEAAECTLIARKGSMYFVITEYGQRGWVNAEKLSYYPPW